MNMKITEGRINMRKDRSSSSECVCMKWFLLKDEIWKWLYCVGSDLNVSEMKEDLLQSVWWRFDKDNIFFFNTMALSIHTDNCWTSHCF